MGYPCVSRSDLRWSVSGRKYACIGDASYFFLPVKNKANVCYKENSAIYFKHFLTHWITDSDLGLFLDKFLWTTCKTPNKKQLSFYGSFLVQVQPKISIAMSCLFERDLLKLISVKGKQL